MRKILGILIFVMIVGTTCSAAAATGVHDPGTGLSNAGAGDGGAGNGTLLQLQNQTMAANQSMAASGQPAAVQQMQREREQLKNELQLRIEQKQQEMTNETAGMTPAEQKVYQNQNSVRLAVHTFLAMGDLDGVIGQNISAIARAYNNSVQATIRAEERIETRSGIARFFAGGDADAAAEILQLRLENEERIRELNRLIGECDCDEETKALLMEQLRNMEEEQVRLRQVAEREQADKGLIGWLWK